MEKILSKKHLFLIGGTKLERKRTVTSIIEKSEYASYRFPSGIESIDDYLAYIRKEKLFTPWYETKGKHGSNQVIDFHMDWIKENEVLVIMEEIQMMDEKWKLEIICWYIDVIENHKKGEKFSHLLITQDEENNLVKRLAEIINVKDNHNRTKIQIVKNNLKIYDLRK